MTQLTQLLDLSTACVEQIEVTQELITRSLSMETTQADCPICSKAASRVHSQYRRTLDDLPCVGKSLRLVMRVRRFFCDNTACARKIFAERLAELTSVSARRTTRCMTALTELGFALGGRAGARLSASLGLASSRMTILRLLRRTSGPAPSTPHILGIDDWAYRRGKTYGTPVVDLERSTPVDLLPDRQAATLATWLRQHQCRSFPCGTQSGRNDGTGAASASQGPQRDPCGGDLSIHPFVSASLSPTGPRTAKAARTGSPGGAL